MHRAGWVALAVTAALAACTPVAESPDDGGPPCAEPCGEVCCGEGFVCEGEQCVKPCVPACEGKTCGDDGCGGSCGACAAGQSCRAGVCGACVPDCTFRQCGDDGCGGSCGTCFFGSCAAGLCGGCTPDCAGKACGPDDCGGTCGACGDGAVCAPAGQCQPCQGDADCAFNPAGSHCNAGACAGCAKASDCGSGGATCTGGVCGNCASEADCAANPVRDHCLTSTKECVACRNNSDCASAGAPLCDPSAHRCLYCNSNGDCAGEPAGEKCLDGRVCVGCLADGDCARGKCDLATHSCRECAADADCAGSPGGARCDLPSGTCVACTSSAQCATAPNTVCTSAHVCDKAADNASCYDRTRLLFHDRTAWGFGDLRTGANHFGATCGGAGKDLVYEFELKTRSGLEAVARPRGATGRLVVTVVKSCSSSEGERGCGASAAPGQPAKASVAALDPGVWTVVVDSEAGAEDEFDLTLTLTAAAPPPANDSCRAPEVLRFNGDVATARGTTALAGHDIDDWSCTWTAGRDVVYAFTNTVTRPATITLRRDPAAPTWYPVLLLRSTCDDDSTTLDCNFEARRDPVLELPKLPPGNYFVVVGDSGTLPGRFELEVKLGPVPPTTATDDCPVAGALAFDGQGVATVAGTTDGLLDDVKLYCGGTGKDAVYAFTLDKRSRVSASVVPTTPTFEPALGLRSPCTATSDDTCSGADAPGKPAWFTRDLDAGTYALWVDSRGSTPSSGGFNLTVERRVLATPANDGCSGAAAVSVGATAVSLDGTLADATDDFTNEACNSYGSPDVFYAVTPSVDGDLEATVTAKKPAGFRPAVFVLNRCDVNATALTCAWSPRTADPVTTLLRGVKQGTTYYVEVSSADPAPAGDFVLRLEVKPASPPLANLTCATAAPLAFTAGRATVTGTTKVASDPADEDTYCGGAGSPDAAWSFTTASSKILSVRLSSKSFGYAPIVSVRDDCTDPYSELDCNWGDTFGDTALRTTLAAGSHTLLVDGDSTSSGEFELTATLSDPVTMPNEDCGSSSPLTFTSGVARVTGSTLKASDDLGISCGYDGNDTVYTLNVTTPTAATLKLRATGGLYAPLLAVRKTCTSGNAGEVGCARSRTTGGTAQLELPELPVGTYFVVVDGQDSAGEYELEVTLAPVAAAPANDTCAGATPVTLDATYPGATTAARDDYGANLASPCSTTAVPGPDVVYKFAPTVTGPVQVTVVPSDDFDVAVWVTEGTCGAGAACVEYVDGLGGGAAEVFPLFGEAGKTYYLHVDAPYRVSGGFTLSLARP